MIQGDVREAVPFGNGHVNASYRLINQNSDLPDYLLQRVNHQVFRDIDSLMQNIEFVTSHIRKKLINSNENYDEKVLTLMHTYEGGRYVEYEGQYWRLFEFMKTLRSFDEAPSINYAYEGAKAFGVFLNQLSDFHPGKLNTTILDFHNLEWRIRQLNEATEVSAKEYLNAARNELDYVYSFLSNLKGFNTLLKAGKLPIRVVHNDTKFNNVLFNEEGAALCVIDLDTVMPGVVHYDFGDGVRTGATTCKEDTEDLSLVDLDMEKFEAFATGYMDGVGNKLNEEEIRWLPVATVYMTFIMGVRFLTDYLNGSVYYKTNYATHNLVRARCQLRLSNMLRLRSDEMTHVLTHGVKIYL